MAEEQLCGSMIIAFTTAIASLELSMPMEVLLEVSAAPSTAHRVQAMGGDRIGGRNQGVVPHARSINAMRAISERGFYCSCLRFESGVIVEL